MIRFRALRVLFGITVSVCSAAALAGLSGCQSEQEQRMAEARELFRQKQTLEAERPGQAAQTGNPSDPAQPAEPPADSLNMPIYPGAKQLSLGPGQSAGPGVGIAMALLETRDPVDSVISFYAGRLKTPDAKGEATTVEDRLAGRRVVRLSVPTENGGLQTVEAREDEGKTSIQLMNVKGGATAAVPRSIPGVPAAAGAAKAPGALGGAASPAGFGGAHSTDPLATDPSRPTIGGPHSTDPLAGDPARSSIGGAHSTDPLAPQPGSPSRDLTVPSTPTRPR